LVGIDLVLDNHPCKLISGGFYLCEEISILGRYCLFKLGLDASDSRRTNGTSTMSAMQ